jgi:hypothetical protein
MSHSRCFIIYLVGIPLSFAYNSYCDAKDAIYKYRNNKLDDYEKKKYYDEDSYVKHRTFQEFPPNILMASIWPITFPMSFIPSLALMINPPDEK